MDTVPSSWQSFVQKQVPIIGPILQEVAQHRSKHSVVRLTGSTRARMIGRSLQMPDQLIFQIVADQIRDERLSSITDNLFRGTESHGLSNDMCRSKRLSRSKKATKRMVTLAYCLRKSFILYWKILYCNIKEAYTRRIFLKPTRL